MEIFLLILVFVIPLVAYVHDLNQYKKTTYYIATKNPYSSVRHNKGINGEYLTYASLSHFEKTGGMFLFNAYLPKGASGTTEIDVILVCTKGVFVFESKNYSGWIFGNEKHRSWTQTLPKRRGSSHKSGFYNPIMQNATHIRCLKRIIGHDVPTKSVIVFSDECVLKNVVVESDDIRVINRRNLGHVMRHMCDDVPDRLTQVQVDNIYYMLYPYTRVTEDQRNRHIENVSSH